LLLVLISLSVFVSMYLLVTALGRREPPRVLECVAPYRSGWQQASTDEVEQPERFSERVLRPLASALAAPLGSLLPSSVLDRLEGRLAQAGRPGGALRFLLLWIGAAFGFPAAILLLVTAGDGRFGSMGPLLVIGAFACSAAIPHVWLNSRARARRDVIARSLPDAFDLLNTSVEAGLGLDAALGRVAGHTEGPFAEELTRALREMSMGRARREALRDLGARTAVPELQAFVTALVQAEQMGTSIGQVLRVQAEQMRVRRRQRAEQQAHKAPVKMMVPLVLFIFPSLFIVILGPAVIQVMDVFSK
jgi:tight adherence protein C